MALVSFVLFLLAGSSVLGTIFHLGTPFVAASGATLQPSLPAEESSVVSPGYYFPIEIDVFSNASWVIYEASSNLTISTAFMNSDQFSQFNSTQSDDISNAISDYNGTSVYRDLSVPQGAYYLVFLDYSSSESANVTFTYEAYPNTPYNYGPAVPPLPTGLASFGIYNESGNAIPYEVETTRVVGVANMSSLMAYNATAPSYNDTVSGATLQLNSMLLVSNANNSGQYVYWCQDTPDFVTSMTQVAFGDNVWNNTDLTGFLSNQSITSVNGNNAYAFTVNGTTQYYYGYGTSNYTYSMPFSLLLTMNETVEPAKGILLQVGEQVFQNGSITLESPVNWFDNITIADPLIQNASFLVSGNESTPTGTFYDTEFVFAGEGNNEATQFTQMNATLGLYYLNETSVQVSPFPSYYSFGEDTAEAADNLHVSYDGGGIAQISIGTPNYIYLGGASPVVSFTTSNSVQSLSTSLSTASSIITSSTSSLLSSSTSVSGIFISDADLVIIAVVVIAIALFAGVTMTRRGSRQNQNPWQ
jgi:thermopsin